MNSAGSTPGSQGNGNGGFGAGRNLNGYARNGGGYGNSTYGSQGYGYGQGWRHGRFVWMRIPGVGWVLVPRRLAMRMGY
jgi:hypothetical protein